MEEEKKESGVVSGDDGASVRYCCVTGNLKDLVFSGEGFEETLIWIWKQQLISYSVHDEDLVSKNDEYELRCYCIACPDDVVVADDLRKKHFFFCRQKKETSLDYFSHGDDDRNHCQSHLLWSQWNQRL